MIHPGATACLRFTKHMAAEDTRDQGQPPWPAADAETVFASSLFDLVERVFFFTELWLFGGAGSGLFVFFCPDCSLLPIADKDAVWLEIWRIRLLLKGVRKSIGEVSAEEIRAIALAAQLGLVHGRVSTCHLARLIFAAGLL